MLDPELTSPGVCRDKLMHCTDLAEKSFWNSSGEWALRMQCFHKHFPSRAARNLYPSLLHISSSLPKLFTFCYVLSLLMCRNHKTGQVKLSVCWNANTTHTWPPKLTASSLLLPQNDCFHCSVFFSLDLFPQQSQYSLLQGQGCMGGESRRLLNQFASGIVSEICTLRTIQALGNNFIRLWAYQ